MPKTKPIAIIMMFICTLFSSVAQLLYKAGVPKLDFTIMSILTNYEILGGLLMYVIGAAIMIYALRNGEVSVLYPIIATSYIWVILFAGIIFNEHISFLKWFGVSVIILGIVFISKGSSKEKESVINYTEGV